MSHKPTEKNSHIYLAAIALAGLSLWLAATLSLPFNNTLRDCLIFLALVPAIIVTGMFTNTLPMPSALKFSREKMNFTLSDAIVLLVACWYGTAPAIFIAGIEGFVSSRRGVRRLSSNIFSFGMLSLVAGASAITLGAVLRFGFGETSPTQQYSIPAVAVAFLAASLIHIVANTGLISTLFALRLGKPTVHLWKENFLLAVPLFLPTSAAASLMYIALHYNALTMVAIGAPLLIAIHFGHKRYRDSIQEQIKLIEQAQQDRAEQAERHVEELNGYIEELELKSAELHHAAFHDALTELPNRAALIEKLRLVIERAKRHEGIQFAVLFLDLDRFKNVNDSLGHTIGDQLLITIARRLENSVRAVDTVARLGGDEFAILLEGIKTSHDAVYMAERVQKELTAPFRLSSHEVFTTTSVGITLSTAGYDHPEDILRDADTAMYRAKESGKACYEVFDQEMHARAVNLLKLETDLRHAVEREEFRVYYQPIVSLGSGRITGFEALVRWQHPVRGFISPAEFISVAEDTRVIIPLGLWVLREACHQMCRWQWQSPDNRSLMLSVNLSGVQFTQPDLVEQIKLILDETHLDPCSLKLEITESVVMENAEAAIAMLVELRALGVRLSIDDFGTGYSSLSYLHRFPTDTLKIDRSFISQMGISDENAEIVRTIKTLASNMGMEVVAEGVETLEQLARLTALECEYGQGYLFSKPVDAEAAETLITKMPQWHAGMFRPTRESFATTRSRTGVAHLRTA